MKEKITIALAGNPNSGKTTMFNALTGANQRVGNYPGVTVEKRVGQVKNNDYVIDVVDLPGIYSLTAYSEDELVARNFVIEEHPDIVVNILNATSLERNLYLCVQFMELGIPVVIALNMMDEVKKQGRIIDAEKLSQIFRVPVVETIARIGHGKENLVRQTIDFVHKTNKKWIPLHISYGSDISPVLLEMTALIEKENFMIERYPARWIALKYLENDEQIISLLQQKPILIQKLAEISDKLNKHCKITLNTTPEAIIADYRYGYVSSIVKQGVLTIPKQENRIAFSDKLDLILTHKLLGPAIMFALLYAIFQITFTLGEIPMGWLEEFFKWLGNTFTTLIPSGIFQSLVVSGIIQGVGGVLSFVPLIIIMFILISFFEDSGYMARMAYMMDRVLRIFGLHGCSVMPFIVSGGIPGGCTLPGIMATRTLRSPREKLATILTAPFMICGAKIPMILLLIGTFFKEGAAVALFWITIGTWIIALLVARIMRSTIIKGEAAPFVMELPPYRMPTLKGILIHTWERAWEYIKKAGTLILGISILLWAFMTFPMPPQDGTISTQSEVLKYSYAGRVGIALESLTSIAGFDWRVNIALLGGFAAKEVIVSTLATAYSLEESESETTLSEHLRQDPKWSRLHAISLLIFIILYSPCLATIVIMSREASWRWAIFSMVFNTSFAFIAAVAVFQIGKLF